MKYLTTIAALVSVVPHIAGVINTPFNVVQCEPQMLTWDNTSPPFYLSIIPGGQPSAAPLKSFPAQTANSMTWIVDIPAGTAVTFALKDSTGVTDFTDIVTIQKGDGSCLFGGGSSSKPANISESAATTENTLPLQVLASSATVGGSHPSPKPSVAAGAPLAGQPTTTTRLVGGIQAVSSSTNAPLASATRVESSADSRSTANGFAIVATIAIFGTFFL